MTDIRVGTDGFFYLAPIGTPLPATTADTLDAAFVDMGEVELEGFEAAFDAATEYVRNMKGLPVRGYTPETTFTFSVKFLETTADVLDLYFGTTTVTSGGGKSHTPIGQPNNTEHSAAIPVIDSKDNSIQQIVIDRFVVGEREAITYANSAPQAYKVTVSALWSDANSRFVDIQHDTDLTS